MSLHSLNHQLPSNFISFKMRSAPTFTHGICNLLAVSLGRVADKSSAVIASESLYNEKFSRKRFLFQVASVKQFFFLKLHAKLS